MHRVDTTEFESSGFQIFDNIIPESTLASIRSFLMTEVGSALNSVMAEIGCPPGGDIISYAQQARQDHGWLQALSKNSRDTLSGHFPLPVRLSELLWEIPLGAKFQDLLQTLLGSQDVNMHMPPTARFVLPGNAHAAVPAHQDISYNKHMTDFITLWVPLVEVDDVCGGVTVYEGSGKLSEITVGQSSDEFWKGALSTSGYEPKLCSMPTGSVLALNKWIIHGSAPNRSNDIRVSIDYRFFCSKDRSSKHYLNLSRRCVVDPATGANHG